MADQKDIEYTYTLIDRIYRYCFGKMGDFSGAKYDGDFSLTLEEAQRNKHEYIVRSLNIRPGSRVLDMGCGWGAFLKCVRDIGAEGIGVTLSSGQQKACVKNGLNVHFMDCRTIPPETFGVFDAVTCIGAFEAFCSRKEWEAGRQDEICRDFFRTVAELLPPRGRFYMQTMVFGKNMIELRQVDINAEQNSDAHICALMERQFPGHWLPKDVDQVITAAQPRFRLIEKSSGRMDYIETQEQWRKKFRTFNLKKYLLYLSLVPKYIVNSQLRERIDVFAENANRLCFEREILDHYRLVFEKA
jgi:cyclopropane-fatty-acyl-phospholipid synthase